MKVTHGYHSGFVVELTRDVLIFDWYQGQLPQWDKGKKVYFFVSHGHGDHYTPKIWDYAGNKNVFYIIDSCCEQERKGDRVLHVQPGREYDLPAITVLTLQSNDEGVAFMVKTEGMEIFHAGDLNVWHWKTRAERENAYSERFYCHEIEKLRGRSIDVAMVPLDPRLEEYSSRAIEHFMQIVGCRYLFPMHYWDREDQIRGYLQDHRIAPYAEQIYLTSLETSD